MLNLDLNVVFEIINIIILFLLLKKFLFAPVTAILEKREGLIRSSLAEAESSKAKANELRSKYEAQLASAGDEAASIVKAARARGEREYELKMSDAARDAEMLLTNARASADAEREKTLRQAQSDIAELALAAASRVVEKNTASADNKKLISDFLTEVGEAN